MICVIEILPGKRAVVSTKGLRRVVLNPSGDVLSELMPKRRANRQVKRFNKLATSAVAVAVRYDDLAQ